MNQRKLEIFFRHFIKGIILKSIYCVYLKSIQHSEYYIRKYVYTKKSQK